MFNSPLKSLPPKVEKLLDEWVESGEILHIWVHEEAPQFTVYTAVVLYHQPETKTLRFYRLFPITGKYQISCDREITV